MRGRLRRCLLAAAAADDQGRVRQRQRATQAGAAGPGESGEAGAAQVEIIMARIAADQAAEWQQHTQQCAGDTGCRMQEINTHPPCFIAHPGAAIGEGPIAVSGLPATAEGAADQEGRSSCPGPVDATAGTTSTSASPR